MSSRMGVVKAYPDPVDAALLGSIAAGRLPGQELLTTELRCLEADGLIQTRSGGLPTLTPRGRLLLQIANGECATPLD